MTAKVKWIGPVLGRYVGNERPPTSTEAFGLHFEIGKWQDVPEASPDDRKRLAKMKAHPEFEVEGDTIHADDVKAAKAEMQTRAEADEAAAKAAVVKAEADAKALTAKAAADAKAASAAAKSAK